MEAVINSLNTMPLGQPWLSKPDTKMKDKHIQRDLRYFPDKEESEELDTKMKTDWGESFKRFSRTLKHESPINGLVEIPLIEIQIIALEGFIRKLLAKQEAEYKKEIYQLYRDEKNHQAWIEKKLKQQHKAQVIETKNFITNKMWLSDTYKCYLIDAEKVIEKLDWMLQDSDK